MAPMTSLQKQLASIAASSSHELDLKAQKSAHSKSLLFEPRVAGSQSMDTIYQICIEGYEELCQVDNRFTRYRSSVFGPQSLREDRMQMTKTEDNDLNVVLESFLALVGSRLLLKPALKSVEWLVRRFRIHDYNTEALIFTFLPYHNTQVFPTLLSILPKQLPPSFKFLHPYVNSLANPPRPVLVHAAANNPGFSTALNRYVLNAAKAHYQYSVLLAFWASTLVQSIDSRLDASLAGRMDVQKQRQEDILIQVLPVLNEALSIRNAPELVLGCFMVITVLVHKVDLDDRVIDALIVAITHSWSSEIIDDALACVAILAERRRATSLPKSALRAILNVDRLAHRLERLRLNQPLGRLASGLALEILHRISKGKSPAPLSLFEQLVHGGLVTPQEFAGMQRQANALLADESTIRADLTVLKKIRELVPGTSLLGAVQLESDLMLVDKPESALRALKGEPSNKNLSESGLDQSERSNFTQLLVDTPVTSLLQTGASAAFHSLEDAYLKCMLTFETTPVNCTPGSRQAVTLFTFLMRAWTTGRTATSRQTALRVMTGELSRGGFSFGELHAIIPYVIVAFSDGSLAVRRSAAALLIALSRLQDQKQDGIAEKEEVDLTELYGLKNDFEVLTVKDALSFIQSGLLPDLEECVVDPQRIGRTLQQCLDSSAKPQAGRELHKLRTSQKETIFASLSSHVQATPLESLQTALLSMLNTVDKVGSHRRSKYLLPALQKWVSVTDSDEPQISVPASQELRTQFLRSVHPADSDAVTYLLSVAMGHVPSGRAGIQGAAFDRLREIWSSLKDTRQKKIAESLVRISLSSEPSNKLDVVKTESSSFLKTVRIPPDVFVTIMDESLEEMEPAGRPSSAKKRRLDASSSSVSKTTGPEGAQVALSKLTFVLELIDTSAGALQPEFVNSLFKLLRSIQGFRRSSSADLSYIQSLALSSLNSIMEQPEATKLVEFDNTIGYADLLVDTVRNTSNTEVRNSALLLLSSLAQTAPQVILHSVMPIFTLISTSTVRQSDDFSAHIVDQTIQRVIPLLAGSLKKQKKDLISAVAEVLLSFASAYDHIPPHRRLHLFGLLASSLGAEDSLFAVVIALVDRFPGNSSVYRFTTQLLRQFSTFEVLMTVQHFVQFIVQCFDKSSSAWKGLLKGNSGEVYQNQTIQELLTVLSLLVSDETFQGKIKADMRLADNVSDKLRAIFGDILQGNIQILRALDQRQLERTTCARAVAHLLGLLPFDQLVQAVVPLLESDDQDLRRSMLKALEGRIRTSTKVDVVSRKAIIAFLPRLTSILEHTGPAQLKQNAVACIDRISEKFGKTDPDAVFQASKVVCSAHCVENPDKLLRILSLHCLATSVEIMGNDFIPLLQQSCQAAFACLEASMTQDRRELKLHNAAYAFLIAVIDRIPFVLPQASLKKLIELSHQSAALDLGSDAEGNRKHMYQIAATKVDIKAVVNVATSGWPSAVKQGPIGLHEHIGFVRTAIDNHTKSVISSNFRALSEFFLLSCDFRRSLAEDAAVGRLYTHNDVMDLETKVLEILMATVLKVNDAVFRPFFLRFSQWCSPTSTSSMSSTHRSITFFNFLVVLSERLKSIVTSYYSYVVERAAEILSETFAKGDLGLTLQASTLAAITSSFKYDQDDFWQSPSQFSAILPALIAYLSASTPAPARTTAAISSLIELAGAATASPDNLKALSSALLRLARSDNARVRLAAVKCEQALTQRVGDDWLGLLPEMLPVINELQDDDEETVEKETHKWIKMIEATLGESLDSMLQ